MACFSCFLQGSVLFLSRFSSGYESLLIPVTLSALLVSTLFLFTLSKQKSITVVDNSIPKQCSKTETQEKLQPSIQEQALFTSPENAHTNELEKAKTGQAQIPVGENGGEFLIRSQDLYSESESTEFQFSSTSSDDEDIDQWPFDVGQRLDCSDDSISDEESLFEIAIPSGQFVSAEEKDGHNKFNLNCQLSADFSHYPEAIFQKVDSLTDTISEMNEEDNLIEIDIYMGSIKCSSFEI